MQFSLLGQREIMTRPDYLVDLDALHIISIDRNHNVRPDSRLMLNVFRAVAAEEDFQEKVRACALFDLSLRRIRLRSGPRLLERAGRLPDVRPATGPIFFF